MLFDDGQLFHKLATAAVGGSMLITDSDSFYLFSNDTILRTLSTIITKINNTKTNHFYFQLLAIDETTANHWRSQDF